MEVLSEVHFKCGADDQTGWCGEMQECLTAPDVGEIWAERPVNLKEPQTQGSGTERWETFHHHLQERVYLFCPTGLDTLHFTRVFRFIWPDVYFWGVMPAFHMGYDEFR